VSIIITSSAGNTHFRHSVVAENVEYTTATQI